MQPPEEKKRPTCQHDPKQWTECPRCIEDYYLRQLTEGPPPLMSGATRDALARYNKEDCATPRPFARLRELVEIQPREPGPALVPALRGRGRAFSVKTEWAQGSFEEDIIEEVVLGALSALEAEKAALELKSAMLEAELERTKAALLASEYEAEQHATSWRIACADRQRELQARRLARVRELESRGIGTATAQAAAEKELPDYPSPMPMAPPWAVRHPGLGPSMLSALRSAVARADAAEAEIQGLREAKTEAYAERNELAALLTQIAVGMDLPAGRRIDTTAEEGFRTLLLVQLPTGQVSWHLPDHEQALTDGLPTFKAPWDGHTTPEKRRRIREAVTRFRGVTLARLARPTGRLE